MKGIDKLSELASRVVMCIVQETSYGLGHEDSAVEATVKCEDSDGGFSEAQQVRESRDAVLQATAAKAVTNHAHCLNTPSASDTATSRLP